MPNFSRGASLCLALLSTLGPLAGCADVEVDAGAPQVEAPTQRPVDVVGAADAPAPAAVAQAEPATPDDWIHRAAEDAEAVVVGTIVDITYGASLPDSQGFTTPHTWITWRVERAMKGYSGDTFTARFIGGPDEARTGALLVSGMPRFDLGDRDVLFVSHNSDWACPLVGGAAGRLRLIRDVAYTDDGRPLTVDAEGRFGLGAPVDLPEVRETLIAGRMFRTHGDPSPAPEGPIAEPAPASSVLDALDRIVRDYPASRDVKSADPREAFVLEMRMATTRPD